MAATVAYSEAKQNQHLEKFKSKNDFFKKAIQDLPSISCLQENKL